MSSPLFIHFGAGAIGRSLVGTLFTQGGYTVTFVDTDARIVQALQKQHGYRVVIKDTLPPGVPATIDVRGVDALSAQDAGAVADAVARADLIGTSVGANALPMVLRSLAPGLARRDRPISILFCENMPGVAAVARVALAEALGEDALRGDRIGLVATSIGKMVPGMPAAVRVRDPLEVWGEAYNEIIADKRAFAGSLPAVPGLLLREPFDAYLDRKLYVHNLGHAVCAYEGFLRGHERICDAMADPVVAQATRRVMNVTSAALLKRYPHVWRAQAMADHVHDLLRRFGNQALGDTVHRVGRDLARKLAPGDRLAGALNLIVETGGDSAPVCRAIAAALHFAAPGEQGRLFPSDRHIRERMAAMGPVAFLRSHARLDNGRFAIELEHVSRQYDQLAGTPAWKGTQPQDGGAR